MKKYNYIYIYITSCASCDFVPSTSDLVARLGAYSDLSTPASSFLETVNALSDGNVTTWQ